MIWRKAAENLASFTRKGSLVGIEGRLQTRNYENQQGQRVYVTEVIVSNFHLLESRQVTEQRPTGAEQPTQYTGAQSTNNYNQRQQNSPVGQGWPDQAAIDAAATNISEDDLPF